MGEGAISDGSGAMIGSAMLAERSCDELRKGNGKREKKMSDQKRNSQEADSHVITSKWRFVPVLTCNEQPVRDCNMEVSYEGL